MDKEKSIKLFQNKEIRAAWNEPEEDWYFSIVDVISVLTDSIDPQSYWRKLKQRLKAEGNETVTNCHALKMPAAFRRGFSLRQYAVASALSVRICTTSTIEK